MENIIVVKLGIVFQMSEGFHTLRTKKDIDTTKLILNRVISLANHNCLILFIISIISPRNGKCLYYNIAFQSNRFDLKTIPASKITKPVRSLHTWTPLSFSKNLSTPKRIYKYIYFQPKKQIRENNIKFNNQHKTATQTYVYMMNPQTYCKVKLCCRRLSAMFARNTRRCGASTQGGALDMVWV